jgi:surface polysaccharide O-acyltransferase-like enzyme
VVHQAQRRAEFDWLRVVALGLLMVFHSTMGFSTWPWHVTDPHQSALLSYFLDFLLRWRVALVFIVSGAALMLALGAKPPMVILRERNRRLLVPLLFAVAVVIPPQVYFERVQRGQFHGSYLDWLPHFADGFYPDGNLSWHQLWFIPYVLVLSAAALPFFAWVRSRAGRRRLDSIVQAIADRHLHWLLVVPLALAQILLRLQDGDAHTFWMDGHGWLEFAVLFLLGAALARWPALLAAIQRERYVALIIGVVVYWALKSEWPSIGDDPRSLPLGSALGWCNLSALNVLAWVLVATGFLTRWLNRPTPALAYLNEAALPVYILHQTLMVYAVFHLHHVGWPLGEKIAITFAFAVTGSLAIYELAIRRSRWLRLLFGVKERAAGIGLEALMPEPITSRWRAPSSSDRRPW